MSVDMQELFKWDDGLFRFHNNPEQLRKCLFLMAEKLGIVEYLSVSKSHWDAFFKRVQDLMHPNPYHNFTHICDVAQAVTCILTSSNITTWLSAEEVTYSFIAAVCHDLDHPGNSNLLEKNSRTAIAEKFTISPLENHHRELACDRDGVLDEFHILANVDHASKQIIKDGVASLILATDMAKHADKTGKLRKLLDGGVEAVRGVRTDAGAKCLVLQNVMKCADISNQARVKVAADFWNAAIYEEFYAEGDRDRREGRKVNPLHDRFTNVVPKSSVGFGNFVVLPMFALIRDFLTLAASIDNGIATATIDHAVSLLKQNTASYAAEAKRVAEQKKTKSTIPERVHDSGKLKGDQQKGEPVSDKNIDHRPGSDDEEPKKEEEDCNRSQWDGSS